MAKDDMQVIVYKILRYLYECTKAGKRPELYNMCCECRLFRIPERYWCQIVLELIEAGYVRGFIHFDSKDGTQIQMTDASSITLKGVQYLEDNGKMKEIQSFLGGAFEMVRSGF